MNDPIYSDYYWSHGTPKGIRGGKESASYAIVADPYRKRISIEKFSAGAFSAITYDSALFDFRLLKPEHQASWKKIALDTTSSLLRDHNGRAIVTEHYQFNGNFCVRCAIHYPNGPLLAKQRMHYKSLGDTCNGVTLYDSEGKTVLHKTYEIDPETGDFTDLLTLEWHHPIATTHA